MLGVAYRGYWIYSQADHAGATGAYLDFLRGVGPAPFQYRAAPLFLPGFLYNHLHWPFRYGLTLEDALASLAAVLLGYELLRRTRIYRQAAPAVAALASAVYAACTLYLFAWQDFYKKPDTDSAALLAMLLVGAWGGRRAGALVRGCVILVVVLLLALVRADVALSLSLGMLAAAWMLPDGALALRRTAALATAAASTVAAVAMQGLLSRVIFPHAAPYAGPVFMLPHDIGNPAQVLVCVAYVLPTFAALTLLRRRPERVDAAFLGAGLGTIPFFLLWITLGRLEEVRIFLPIGLAAAPLAAESVARRFSDAMETASVR